MPRTGEFLLDSNAIIAFFRGEHSFSTQFASSITFVPAVAIGELYYGAFKSGKVALNTARIDAFAAAVNPLVCDAGTSRIYGMVKQRLRQSGSPIPENDIWIAAVALQHDLTLATRDAHFKNVQDLFTQSW